MATGISIKVNSLSAKAAKRKMRQLQKKIPNLTVPHKQISIMLDAWVLRNFKNEGRIVGGWPPFKLKGRRKKGGGIDSSAKLLQDTGVLRRSFTPFSNRHTAGIGSEIKYAKPHEFGDSKRNLPQRRMLPKEKEIRRQVFEIYENYIEKTIRKRV